MAFRVIFSLVIVLCLAAQLPGADAVALASPDRAVQFRLSVDGNGRLQYAVSFKDKPVIQDSAIGIKVDGVNLADGVEIGMAEPYKVNETYPWNGAHSTAVDNCNGLRIAVTHRQSRTAYTLEVRAYNDGIAFRHIVPGEGTRVPDEATVFQVPANSQVWFEDMDDGYEGVYRDAPVSRLLPNGFLAPPVTYRLGQEGPYVSITEGRLRHYSGMGLQADHSGGLHARLAHDVEPGWVFRWQHAKEEEAFKKPASITGKITTPWRIAMIGADLNALVNCDIVHNVSAPPDPKLFPNGAKTDWIKPGRSLWMYIDGGKSTIEGMKDWADMAQKLKIEYNLFENWWSNFSDEQLKDLADYSRQRGVGLVVWRSRTAFKNDPNQTPAEVEKNIRAMFDRCKKAGIAGVKIDFFDHEDKSIIELYEQILTLAAEYHLMVDFHGANKPTGLERTYPNIFGYEAIRGMEMSPPWALNNVITPFTRYLAGMGDFTPMHFGTAKMGDTTWAHQIATALVLQSPLLVFTANPVNILANPAVDVIRDVPSVWDETVVLPGSQIGQVAAYARRKGDKWFVAVLNGPVARTIKIDLSFLGPAPQPTAGRGGGGFMRPPSYYATLVRDTDRAAAVEIQHEVVRRSDSLYVNLRSGGGFVGEFVN